MRLRWQLEYAQAPSKKIASIVVDPQDNRPIELLIYRKKVSVMSA